MYVFECTLYAYICVTCKLFNILLCALHSPILLPHFFSAKQSRTRKKGRQQNNISFSPDFHHCFNFFIFECAYGLCYAIKWVTCK